MSKIVKITLFNQDIVSATFTMPSGQSFSFNQGDPPFVTDDPEIIDFLSKQKGIGISEPSDKETLDYLQAPEHMRPHVANRFLSDKDVKPFAWSDDQEAFVIQALRSRGYIVTPSKISENIVDATAAINATVNKIKAKRSKAINKAVRDTVKALKTEPKKSKRKKTPGSK